MKSKNALNEVLKHAKVCCWNCGTRYGKHLDTFSADTYHMGECGVCGAQGWVTTVADFGYLKFKE